MGLIFSSLFGWLLRTVLIKFVTFTVLFVVVSSFIQYLIQRIGIFSPDSLTSGLSSFTPGMWYFADITMFTTGCPAVISAAILRFGIRRIPFIG